MIPIDDHLPSSDDSPVVDDAILDLLVDGELSPAERRTLLARLDRVPDGWRRCALAFLEAQCWREEFRKLPQSAPEHAVLPSDQHGPAQRSSILAGLMTGRNLGTLAAMAASFLLALGLSFLVHRSWPAPTVENVNEQVATNTPERPSMSPAALKEHAWEPASGPWQTVMLPVGDGAESLRLPAAERDTIDDAWVNNLPPAVSEDVLRALKQSGHEVQMQRRLMPFPMRDGRRLVVPVDQVDIHTVGYPGYQ